MKETVIHLTCEFEVSNDLKDNLRFQCLSIQSISNLPHIFGCGKCGEEWLINLISIECYDNIAEVAEKIPLGKL